MWILAIGSSPTRYTFAGLAELLFLRGSSVALPACMPAWRFADKGAVRCTDNAHPCLWEARRGPLRLTYLLSYGDRLFHASNTGGLVNQTLRGTQLTLTATLQALQRLLHESSPRSQRPSAAYG